MPVRFEIQGGERTGYPAWLGCLPFALIFLLMCLIPLAMYDIGRSALEKLGLSPANAGLAVLGIFLGSFINIPVKELRRDELQPEVALGPMGMIYPRQYRRVHSRTLIAVNLGGCVIPVLIALLQISRLAASGNSTWAVAIVSALSIFVCYRLARPVEGIGIMMPGFIPPLVSVLATWVLLPGATPAERAATAFVAGVTGPVIGADLLHLKDVAKTPVGMMSIGGAGTFDGIVLSGILAALLA